MYNTIENAMKTNNAAVILEVENYEYKGVNRQSIKAKKSLGKKVYTVIKYENGMYSEAV